MIPFTGAAVIAGCAPASDDLAESERPDGRELPEEAEGSFVETRLARDGSFVTTSGGEGRPGELYQIGSISKFACTLAVLDMQRAGELSLSDPVSKLLPDYRGENAQEITLRNLLENRSGIAEGLFAAMETDASLLDDSIAPIDAANRFAANLAGPAAGTSFDYVIANWIVVQAILEEVGEAPIQQVLSKHVFEPAGLSKTTTFVGGLPGENAVEPSQPLPSIPNYLTCAGGLASTTEELILLVRHPYRTADFAPEDLEALVTVTTEHEDYTIGGRVKRVRVGSQERTLSWQSGSNGSFKSRAAYDPELDTGFAVVTNEGSNTLVDERRDAWLRDEVQR